MAKKNGIDLDLIGRWAFLIALIIAVLTAFISINAISTSTIILVLFILGLIVGLLNINKKDVTEYLVSAIALLAVGSLGALSIGQLSTTVNYLQKILNNFIIVVAASTLIVSLKTIIKRGRD